MTNNLVYQSQEQLLSLAFIIRYFCKIHEPHYHCTHGGNRPVIFVIGKRFTKYCNSLHHSLMSTFCTSFINILRSSIYSTISWKTSTMLSRKCQWQVNRCIFKSGSTTIVYIGRCNFLITSLLLLLQPFYGHLTRTTWAGRYQKDKPFWILLKQR